MDMDMTRNGTIQNDYFLKNKDIMIKIEQLNKLIYT